jgi:hypothetical protein
LISIGALRDRYRGNVEPERSQRYLELTALLLALLVVVQLLWLGLGALRESPVTPIEPARDSLRVLSAAGTGAITGPQSLELQSRPLFWASRRPAPGAGVMTSLQQLAELKPAGRLDELELTGVLGSGDQGTAIVSFKGKQMRLAIGDEVQGWALQSVSLGEAVFESAGARDVRRLLPQPAEAKRTAAEPPDQPGAADKPLADALPGSAPDGVPDSIQNDKKSDALLSLGGR